MNELIQISIGLKDKLKSIDWKQPQGYFRVSRKTSPLTHQPQKSCQLNGPITKVETGSMTYLRINICFRSFFRTWIPKILLPSVIFYFRFQFNYSSEPLDKNHHVNPPFSKKCYPIMGKNWPVFLAIPIAFLYLLFDSKKTLACHELVTKASLSKKSWLLNS